MAQKEAEAEQQRTARQETEARSLREELQTNRQEAEARVLGAQKEAEARVYLEELPSMLGF